MTETWAEFQNQTDAERVFLVEIEAAEAADPANTVVLRMATHDKAFDHFHTGIVRGVPRLRRSLQGTFGGMSAVSWGELECIREDGHTLTPDDAVEIDHLLDGTYLVAGRPIRIKYGGENLPESEYQTIFEGTCGPLRDWDNAGFRIEIGDPMDRLRKIKATPNTIPAALRTPDAHVGRPVPLALGRCLNVSPILIDDVAYTYLVSDTATLGFSAVTNVYDDGLPVGYADPGDGTFTLTLAPVGTITCDVDGATFGGFYADSVAEILDGLLSVLGGVENISSSHLSALETAIPWQVGLYVADAADLLTVMDRLCAGLPIWRAFTRVGEFRCGEFAPPAGAPDTTIDDTAILLGTLRGETEPAIRKQRIRYGRNHTPIPEDRAAGSLTAAEKAWLAAEWRTAEADDPAILDRFPLAEEAEEMETRLVARADAEACAAKWIALRGAFRRRYRMTLKPLSLAYALDAVARLTFPRFGLEGGTDFRIVAVEEDFNAKTVSLELWG